MPTLGDHFQNFKKRTSGVDTTAYTARIGRLVRENRAKDFFYMQDYTRELTGPSTRVPLYQANLLLSPYTYQMVQNARNQAATVYIIFNESNRRIKEVVVLNADVQPDGSRLIPVAGVDADVVGFGSELRN